MATDLSGDALEVARENAERLGVADRVTFIKTSYLDDVDGIFDLVVANPPYVRDGDKIALSRDVRHEPEVALFGGPDGLRDVGGVLDAAVQRVKPGGWFVMEFGYGQEDDVCRLVGARASLRLQRVRDDLQGIARTAVIQEMRQLQLLVYSMSDCLFCRIISGEIKGSIVYQDNDLVAIKDINPQAPLHVLIMPRQHIATINDLTPRQ